MCRIFGICQLNMKNIEDVNITQILSEKLEHGGPDETGSVRIDSCILGINRLAIMDPNNGQQPFETPNSSLVYNGEIYNYDEIKKELQQKDIILTTNCDGEIIPYMYEAYGIQAFSKLDGMFSIAIWDKNERKLLLARDCAGMKPLFYTIINGLLIFSSEIQALLSLPNNNKEFSYLALDKYFSLKAVYTMKGPMGNETIYPGIWSIPPGHVLSWDEENGLNLIEFEVYPDMSQSILKHKATEEELSTVLKQEVSKLVHSDVPICSILSGGLDSSIITSLVKRYYKQPLHTFTICYRGNWIGDERKYAKEVSEYLGTIHHEIELNPDDIPEILPKVIRHLGQPNADPITVSSYVLFKTIKEYGFKVAISGDGSDEIFGGYNRFKDFLLNQNDTFEQKIDIYLNALSAIPKEIRDELYTEDFKKKIKHTPINLSRLNNQTDLESVLYFEVKNRLPIYHLERVDHLSSAHGVEVRIPFCQKSVVEFAFSLSDNERISNDESVKVLLSRTAEKFKLIPKNIIRRKKQPFTLPITQMLNPKYKLGKYLKEILLDPRVASRGIINTKKVEEMIKQLEEPIVSDEIALSLWSLLTLELWFREFMETADLEESVICI